MNYSMMKIRKLWNMTMPVFLVAVLLSSCEKKEKDPAWIGTWIHEEVVPIPDIGIPVPVKITLILEKTSFEYLMAAEVFNQFIDVAVVKGDLGATDTEFTITPKTMAMANDSGELEWISEGDPGWEEEIAQWELGETNSASYELDGNTLLLILDGESIAFTRE